jgi:multiple sugar transport system permease protein
MQGATQRDAMTMAATSESARWRHVRESIPGWLFASPWLIGFVVFTAGPMLAAVYLSLTSYDLLQPPRWIGLGNFAQLIQDQRVWNSLKVTTLYSFVSVPVNLFFGLALALLVNRQIRFLAFWRTAYYLPAVVPAVATAMLWRWLMDGRYGLFNYMLKAAFGIDGPDWLASSDWVIPAFIIMSF